MRGVTSAVTDLTGNIEGISQTVVQGYFTVVLVADFDKTIAGDAIRQKITEGFREGEVSVIVREFKQKSPAVSGGERYILTLMGREAPGILKKLTVCLTEKRINIEDWFFRIDGEKVTHIGEITVPPRLDIRQLQEDLRALFEPQDLRVHCRHENLFRATNEVESIRLMLSNEQ